MQNNHIRSRLVLSFPSIEGRIMGGGPVELLDLFVCLFVFRYVLLKKEKVLCDYYISMYQYCSIYSIFMCISEQGGEEGDDF